MDQLERVAEVTRRTLGEDVIGAYLHGSAVLGGLRPNSDIDVLAVSRRPTTGAQKRALIDALMPISGRGDPTGRSRSVELQIVVLDQVRPWRYPPAVDFKYGDWLREEFERGELTPWETHDPDLALLLTVVLQGDHPIFGPPPGDLLDPVPATDVRRAVLDSIPATLGYLDGDEANVTLTFARMWLTIATGDIRRKDEAADWALARLPPEHRPVLAHARAIYLGGFGDAAWGDLLPLVRAHVDVLHEQIMRAAADGSPAAARSGS